MNGVAGDTARCVYAIGPRCRTYFYGAKTIYSSAKRGIRIVEIGDIDDVAAILRVFGYIAFPCVHPRHRRIARTAAAIIQPQCLIAPALIAACAVVACGAYALAVGAGATVLAGCAAALILATAYSNGRCCYQRHKQYRKQQT